MPTALITGAYQETGDELSNLALSCSVIWTIDQSRHFIFRLLNAVEENFINPKPIGTHTNTVSNSRDDWIGGKPTDILIRFPLNIGASCWVINKMDFVHGQILAITVLGIDNQKLSPELPQR